jgi:outer membrane receptor protein involved in Fe transport
MILRFKPFLGWLACILALTLSGTAQAQTTGDIRGTVTDATGAVLPGVTVTIASEALLGGSRTMVTNELGVYRFISVPIGTYTVEAALSGFETKRYEGVRASLNATATVDITLGLSTVSETVTVTGESPVVDVTESGVSSKFESELIQNIATQRAMTDLIQVSPGMSASTGDSNGDRTVAFGSHQQSNSWKVDGVEVSAPETGASWWEVDPDVIEEIQIMGVGAPAEFGNTTGAVFNIVTKQGSNTFSGNASYYGQWDALTDESIVIDDFAFHRDKFNNITGTIGGPVVKDRLWFFGSYAYLRDGSTEPGVDPTFTPVVVNDKYQIKMTARATETDEFGGFFHYVQSEGPDAASPYSTPSALSTENYGTPAWGANWTRTLSTNALLELKYAGWWTNGTNASQTGSLDEPFIDFSPPDGGPTRYSGGIGPYQGYTWEYTTWRQQFNAKVTTYTEDFLSSQHDFKFGVQWSKGSADTVIGVGPTGSYAYNYGGTLYRVFQDPYEYGGATTDLGFFVDDAITVNDRLTLNAGVRFDFNRGSIPDFDRFTIGDNTVTDVGFFEPTGATVPGVPNLVNWNLISPRFGFALQPDAAGRSVIRGSFGVYYDQDIIGNWDAPAPGLPPIRYFSQDPDTGEFVQYDEISSEDTAFSPDLKAPRTLQYSIGFERQLGQSASASVQYVHKDASDMVGWEILGGSYEPFPFTDPITGTQYTLLSIVDRPTIRKGNDPGEFPGSENLDYESQYDGVVFQFDKRYADNWGFSASYTWSKSEGLIPRPLAQVQFNPFYGSKEGSDPNNWVNADGRLQGDRPHMFRLQSVHRLPWDLMFSANLDFSSGRAHTRQIRVGGLAQGTKDVIMAPGGAEDCGFGDPCRLSAFEAVDISIGKRFRVGDGAELKFDAYVFNLLNSDNELNFNTLRVQTPDDEFVPLQYTKPRRIMFRAGFSF